MTKYKSVFFDLDDTLVDTYKNSYETLREIFILYQLDKAFESFESFATKYQSINNDLWHRYEFGEISKEELQTQRFYLTLKDNCENISPDKSLVINTRFMKLMSEKKNIIKGAIDVLDYLKSKGYKLIILSNGFKEMQGIKLENAGMTNYFDAVVLSDHLGKNKPHPDIFKHALSISKSANNETIMIGDNINTDILGAKNSFIDQIWFNPSSKTNTTDIIPSYEIKDLNVIKDIL